MKFWSIGVVLGCLSLFSGELEKPLGHGIHQLKDGTLLEGRLSKVGDEVVIKTPLGERRFASDLYSGEGQLSLEEVERQYQALKAKTKKGALEEHHRLARWCVGEGYLSGLRQELNAILTLDVDDRFGRDLLARVASNYVLHSGERETKGRNRRKLVEYLLTALAPEDNVGAVLAFEKGKGVEPNLILQPAMKAMRHSRTRVRWCGVAILGALNGEEGRISRLYKQSLSDGNWVVRREAVRGLKALGADDFVPLFSKQLTNPEAELRVRAAMNLGELGSKNAVEPLAKAMYAPGSPRSHIATLTQTAYVKDYDVEVAQTAFIADPIVDVVQDGAILDVQVISVNTERRIYANALNRLTGANLASDPKAWKEWLEQQR